MAITRRQLLHSTAFAALAPALGATANLSAITPALAQAGAEPSWRHALSLFGDIKYPAGFKRFDYVNPDAPKGGTVRQISVGTFDNFNYAVAGLKGNIASAVGLIYESLTTSAQ
ncbi:MAG: microcin transport system substrate-binding protein, partial [Bradyrhizobium sp.]